MSEPNIETEIRPCKYVYTTEEMGQIAERLAIKTQELESLEDEKKAVASSYKERIETCQMQMRRAARQYKDGFEMRDIECMVTRDYDTCTISYMRLDNGEVTLVRPMTAAERQMRLQDAAEATEEAGEPQDQETEEEAEENDGYDGLPENLTKYLKDKEGRGTSRKTRATQ